MVDGGLWERLATDSPFGSPGEGERWEGVSEVVQWVNVGKRQLV